MDEFKGFIFDIEEKVLKLLAEVDDTVKEVASAEDIGAESLRQGWRFPE